MTVQPSIAKPLVRDPDNIRLGIAGKVDENDHPYSWSAIINGYDPAAMRKYAHPVISDYLAARSKDEFGIDGVHVTHGWCDDPADTTKVAAAAHIVNLVRSPDELLDQVDAVLIPTDRGDEHVARARPFVEAGMPIFIDKPLCDNCADLAKFQRWIDQGKPIMSCSAMRYATEFAEARARLAEVGELRLISITMAKSWLRYGIHALEAVYPFLSPGGWLTARNCGSAGAEVVRYQHRSGVAVLVCVGDDWFGGFGSMHIVGTKSELHTRFRDSFSAFKTQLEQFVKYLRTGRPTINFDETVELIQLLIAGEESRIRCGDEVALPLSE